jgi:hypothetical protein
MADKLEKDEKARIEAQIKELGPEGLAKLGKVLDDAKAEHDKPIPDEIITAFPVPDVKTITWIPVQSVQEPGKGRKQVSQITETELSKLISRDGETLPFFVQYDHVQVSNLDTLEDGEGCLTCSFFSLILSQYTRSSRCPVYRIDYARAVCILFYVSHLTLIS